MARYGSLERLDAEAVAALADAAPRATENPECDLSFFWHAFHFVLTGTAHEGTGPLAFLLVGGEAVYGDGEAYDDGMIGPKLYAPDEVRAIDQALRAFTPEVVRARFDVEQLDDEAVYPTTWVRDYGAGQKNQIKEFVQAFTAMKGFVALAAERGEALVFAVV